MGAPFHTPQTAASDGWPLLATMHDGTLDDLDAMQARMMHRALMDAVDHAIALMDAIEASGVDLEPENEHGDVLDYGEGDPLEDAEDGGDDEPSLGAPEIHEHAGMYSTALRRWIALPADQRHWAQGSSSDREVEITDEPHDVEGEAEESLGWPANVRQVLLGPNTADGDLTAPERFGKGFVRCGPDDAEDGHDAEDERDGGTDDGEDASHWSGQLRFRSRRTGEAAHVV